MPPKINRGGNQHQLDAIKAESSAPKLANLSLRPDDTLASPDWFTVAHGDCGELVAQQSCPGATSALVSFMRLHLCLKTLVLYFCQQRVDCHAAAVERDMQQVGIHAAIPIVFDQYHALKPFQGLLDPVGSVGSQKLQTLAHLADPKCHRLLARRRSRNGRFDVRGILTRSRRRPAARANRCQQTQITNQTKAFQFPLLTSAWQPRRRPASHFVDIGFLSWLDIGRPNGSPARRRANNRRGRHNTCYQSRRKTHPRAVLAGLRWDFLHSNRVHTSPRKSQPRFRACHAAQRH